MPTDLRTARFNSFASVWMQRGDRVLVLGGMFTDSTKKALKSVGCVVSSESSMAKIKDYNVVLDAIVIPNELDHNSNDAIKELLSSSERCLKVEGRLVFSLPSKRMEEKQISHILESSVLEYITQFRSGRSVPINLLVYRKVRG